MGPVSAAVLSALPLLVSTPSGLPLSSGPCQGRLPGSQDPSITYETVSLATLVRDQNGDFIPDRVGGSFQVEGFANMEPRRARAGARGRDWFFVTIQDDEAGVRLLTQEESLLDGLVVGSRVMARGTLTHRRGSEELILDELQVLAGGSLVPPLEVEARGVVGEDLMHRLVRITGEIRRFEPAMERFVLDDSTGSVEVRVTPRFTSDPLFQAKLEQGGEITVVGVVGQADREPPFDQDYRVAPRSPGDLVWMDPSDASQEQGGRWSRTTLAEINEDQDRDFVPDGVGRAFQVEGYTNMEARRARGSAGGAEWFFTTIEDGTAGIRLLTPDETILAGIEVGRWVVARGVLTHRRGSEELVLDELRVTDRISEVVPEDALARDLNGETFMHRLVRVEGEIQGFDPSQESFSLRDRTGSVDVRVTSRFLADPELRRKLNSGGAITVAGILTQSDREPPFDGEYRLAPRDPADHLWPPQFPTAQVALSLLFLSLAGAALVFLVSNRRAERRAEELAAMARDLEDSHRALETSEEEYRDLFHEDRLGRFVTDPEGALTRWNGAFETFVGRSGPQLDGRKLEEILSEVPPDLLPGLPTGVPAEVEVSRCGDAESPGVGHLSVVWVDTEPSGVRECRGSIVDITERRRMEVQLQRSQRMETVGRLAGGIAHEINNALAVIMANTDLIQLEGPFPKGVENDLESVKEAAVRSSRLTSQLLTMARRGVAQPESLNLNDIVSNLAPILAKVLGPGVELRTDLDPETPPVWADPSEIEQMLVNLVTNAGEAMSGQGEAIIETTPCRMGGDGMGACLRVHDMGGKVDPEILNRMFEPFFSTKEGHVGLGLSTTYGVVTRQGGTVTAANAPESGTTVEIRFPAEEEGERYATGDAGTDGRLPGRQKDRLEGTVLLAEDDPEVRTLARRILEGAGYEVIETKDGESARAAFLADPHGVDALVTDIIMPGLGGWDLADALSDTRPDLPVVFMSGYVDQDRAREQFSRGSAVFLSKPFRPQELIEAIERSWAGGPGRPWVLKLGEGPILSESGRQGLTVQEPPLSQAPIILFPFEELP